MQKYRLVGKLPVPCDDLLAWGSWYETADRTVAKSKVGPLSVSTVFLGMDHRFHGNGDPILFETMIFGCDDEDGYQTRCATWDEAERMHAAAELVAASWLARAMGAGPSPKTCQEPDR